MITRRDFQKAVIATGALAALPIKARAQYEPSLVVGSDAGEYLFYAVHHASFVIATPDGKKIFVDPVGGGALYEGMGAPDLIAITHEHGDHFDADTLTAISTNTTQIVTNPAVGAMLPEGLAAQSKTPIANGETYDFDGVSIEAIPAYNITEGRLDFHPKGRDNGYVFNLPSLRFYASGDTEDTPEMRALTEIDLCFMCMNLPFTQTAEQAAEAVQAFKPKQVSPYHYRGRDGGSQDPARFQELVGAASEVFIIDWYEGDA